MASFKDRAFSKLCDKYCLKKCDSDKKDRKAASSAEYVRVNVSDFPGGTSSHNVSFKSSYPALVRGIGSPNEGDGYKVSSEWIFKNPVTGNFATLYDWKETSLYDTDLPSVEKFRSGGVREFHIGSTDKAEGLRFVRWLRKKVPSKKKR